MGLVLLYLFYPYQRNKEETGLLSHQYSGGCFFRFISIPKGSIFIGTAQIVTVPASPTTDQDALDEAPDSRVGSIDRDTQDMEQLEYQYRPMTPGEEEIMKIHEKVIHCPCDMIEKSRDLTIFICRSHQEIPPYSSVDFIKRFIFCSF